MDHERSGLAAVAHLPRLPRANGTPIARPQNHNGTIDNVVELRPGRPVEQSLDGMHTEGSELIEAAARFLDGDGRAIARTLTGTAAMAYATESMRLTTRLVQLGRWIKLSRRVATGRISLANAKRERARLTIDMRSKASHNVHFDGLPTELKALVVRSFRLRDTIKRFDDILFSEQSGARPVLSEALDAMAPTHAVGVVDSAPVSVPGVKLAYTRETH